MKLLVMMDATRVSGPAKQLLAITPVLQRAGIESEFIVMLRRGRPTPFLAAVEELGRPVYRVGDRFAFDPVILGSLGQLFRHVRADILQTHSYRPGTMARMLWPVRPRRWSAWWHGETWENWRVRLYNKIDRWALRGADAVVTVSETQAAVLRPSLGRKRDVSVIPNAILLGPSNQHPDERQRQRVECSPFFATNTFVFGVFGRFSHEKGQDILLDAVHRVNERKRSPIRAAVLFLGEGSNEGSLREQVNRLGLTDSVVFGGYREDVSRYYNVIDALVVPSRSEGLPNVVLEAAASRRPIIAAKVGGIPEVLTDGETGWLVPPGNPAALADVLIQVMTDPGEAERRAARAELHVRQHYGLDHRARLLIDHYQALMRQ